MLSVSLDPAAATTLTRPSGADLIVVKSTIILDYLESPSQSLEQFYNPEVIIVNPTNIYNNTRGLTFSNFIRSTYIIIG